MTITEVTCAVIDSLEKLEVPYMLVGAFSSNAYGVPRSTHDADLVIDLGTGSVRDIADQLGPAFRLDPQMSFESVTMTRRFILEVVGGPLRVELFLLSDDAHDQERFRRRQQQRFLDRVIFLPTPEDVIIMKLRWATLARRVKDSEDVRDVIAIQGDHLDWDYIHRWVGLHGSRELLDEIRRSIPGI